MARYKNFSKSDLTFSDGTVLAAGKEADVEPTTIVEQAWVADGLIAPVEQAEEAQAEGDEGGEPGKEPSAAPAEAPAGAQGAAPAQPEGKAEEASAEARKGRK